MYCVKPDTIFYMPAILRSQDEIQIIAFSDPLNPQDFSTLRLKIDQKMVQGRANFIFDLTDIDFKITRSLPAILELITFCSMRQTLPSIISPDKKNWKKLEPKAGNKIDYFTNLQESLDHIKKMTGDKEKGIKSESKAKDPRREDLEKIINDYKKKVPTKSYDPLGLAPKAKQYQTSPSKEILKALEAAILQYKKLKSENEETNQEVTRLAEQMMNMTFLRRKAIRSEEIVKRKDELMILLRIAEIEKEILRINNG